MELSKLAAVVILFLGKGIVCVSQNIAISTDGAAAETGVMLHVKGTNLITAAGLQNIFQVTSLDALSTAQLKLRLGLYTNGTAASRYGVIDVYDAGASAYRPLSLQPSGGNVGIGTTNANDGVKPHKFAIVDDAVPAPWHDDVGQLHIRGATSSAKQLTLGVNTTAAPSYAWIQSSLNGTAGRALALNPDGSGNVGIGISTPQSKLDVEGGAVIGATYSGTNAAPANGLLVEGNIGIGTTAPTNILSLGGNTARTIWMERTTTAATAGFGLTLQAGGAIAGTNNLTGGDLTLSSGTSTGTGTSNIHFFTSTAGASGNADRAPTEKMTIMGSGRVGIATTNPVTWLEIAPPGNSVAEIGLISTSGAGAQIAFGDNAGSEGYDGAITWNGSLSNILEFRAGANGTGVGGGNTRMTISGNTGYVGIGTTSPNTKLQVAGGISMPITVSAAAATLDNTYYTFISTAAAAIPTIPVAAAANTGWIYILVNETGAAITIGSSRTYIDFFTAATGTIPANGSIMIQSNGTNWYQIK